MMARRMRQWRPMLTWVKTMEEFDLGVGVDADVLGDDAVADDGAGDDAALGDDGVDGHAGAAGLAEDELGGGILAGAGADGPAVVVEVEDGETEATSMLAS